MIEARILKKLAREWKLRVDAVEKHYVLGWILFGIAKSSVGKNLVFKGGTSLSKIYFPSDWRLSEDLDFTLVNEVNWEIIIKAISEEVPQIVKNASGMTVSLRPKPHTNPDYLQAKMKYNGPIGPGTIKIEISREKFVGKTTARPVPNSPSEFDYPKFSVNVYAIENIVGEKTRAILQRGYIRDYYDVWRLFKEKTFDQKDAREIFDKKCSSKGVKFSSVDDFFPKNIAVTLKEHLHNLMRLTREEPPSIETILKELRESLVQFLK